jgi:hypothetical protein
LNDTKVVEKPGPKKSGPKTQIIELDILEKSGSKNKP